MKTLIALFFLFLSSFLYAQQGNVQDFSTDNLVIKQWYATDLDSAETFHSDGFGAEDFISNYIRGNSNGFTLRDTTVNNYLHSNDSYAEVNINGSGSVDSASIVTISGLDVAGNWVVFDTLATAKSTSIRTTVSLFTAPFFTQWRFDITGANLTVSGFDMVVLIKLICPKRRD